MASSAPPTFEDLVAEVARLRALVEERPPVPPPAATTEPAPAPPGDVTADGPIDRRAALRRAGMLAAGAVAGGTALTAITATPAAAATLTGSGNPGVVATGLGGDGLSATTDAATKSAVYATTSVATAYGAYLNHAGGGTALEARNASTDYFRPTVKVANTAGGAALNVTGRADVNGFLGVTSSGSSSALSALSVGSGGTGGGISVNGGGETVGGYGIQVQNYKFGAIFGGGLYALSLYSRENHLYLTPVTGDAPPARTSVGTATGMLTQVGSDLWHCVAGGSPGSWRKVSGDATAGAFHVLAAPARVYDSRPGTAPTSVGPKTKLAANGARTLDLKVNASGVPAGATAALLTILLVNATSGNGNLTVWANGVAKPLANTMVWGGSTGRFTATAVTALDAQARIQVSASLGTDLVVDVVGYYR